MKTFSPALLRSVLPLLLLVLAGCGSQPRYRSQAMLELDVSPGVNVAALIEGQKDVMNGPEFLQQVARTVALASHPVMVKHQGRPPELALQELIRLESEKAVIRIVVTSPDRQLSADVANAVARRYALHVNEQAREALHRQSLAEEERLKVMTGRMAALEGQITTLKTKILSQKDAAKIKPLIVDLENLMAQLKELQGQLSPSAAVPNAPTPPIRLVRVIQEAVPAEKPLGYWDK